MADFESNVIDVEFEYDSISNNIDTNRPILHKTNVIGSIFRDINTSQFLQLRWSEDIPHYIEAPKQGQNTFDSVSKTDIPIKNREKNTDPSKHKYKVEMYKIKKRSDKIRKEMFRDAWSIAKAYMNKDVEFSWNTVKNQVLDTARKYGLAEEANLLAQTEHSIKTMSGKSWKDNIKYTINALGDPTTVLGTVSKTSSHIQSNLTSKLSSWF
jgi:hypothetical protein